MTTDEKKLLQAKNSLEEAEMRDRQKEQKVRTRRLIRAGAIIEKAINFINYLQSKNAFGTPRFLCWNGRSV